MPSFESILLGSATLLLVGVAASKISARLGVPALLLFLGLGMLAGSDGIGGIWFDDAGLAQSLGSVALALILFAGGLATEWDRVAPVLWRAVSLATIGVALTAALIAAPAIYVLGVTPVEALLLGAIVSSTDAAAVFAVLRGQRLALKGRLQPLLEFESGSNDPMAVFLTVAFTQLLSQPETGALAILPLFLKQMAFGTILGAAFGYIAPRLINRLQLGAEGLYPVLTLAIALTAFSATAVVGGSGFLAVYIAGIVMGNSDFVHKRSLTRFHDGLAWLMQITMFLVLGLLVFPSQLPNVAGRASLMALILVFVARPVSVFVSLAFARLGWRHKLLVSWVGLRGAVPIILATFPLVAGLPRAELYFNLVFFVVLISVLLQGTTIAPVARMLRLQSSVPPRAPSPLEFIPAGRARSEMIELLIPEGSPVVGKQVLQLELPKSALMVLIGRGDDYIAPRGSTVMRAGDVALILVDRNDIPAVRARLGVVEALEDA
jgi:potassium/hydrogen antiporter